ncbi:hypothetical protein [Spongiactinospora gelatinilytica]|uniref:hypothetical protein n=1 Tax=Spongiactinospora gelatinilytica TaxID=2666298 RepID=UPI0011B93680|nr:hypothetical protein [Spongiactinospora gelatinilytica]
MGFGRNPIAVISATAAIILASAIPASADPWPFDDIFPDKSTHSYCYTSSVGSGLKSYIPGAMNYLASATTIPGVPLHATCDTKPSDVDGDPATDVAWFDIWVNVGYGEAPCRVRTASNSNHCDQRFAKINTELIDSEADPHHQYIKTVCHELGHTAGMDHYSPFLPSLPDIPPGNELDCMASGDVTRSDNPAGSWIHKYSEHHIDDANPWWS